MFDQILFSLNFIRPELALTLTILGAIITDLVSKKKAYVAGACLGGLLVTVYMLTEQIGVTVPAFYRMLAVDPFALFFKFVIGGTSILILLFSLGSNEVNSSTKRLGEYYVLLVVMTLGMFLMAGSNNLLMMYLTLELTGLSSYILTGYTKEAKDSSEASLKYVIYGALSSGVMLYGISLIYGLTGSLELTSINAVLVQGNAPTVTLLIASVLMMVGFGYKISAVPFHFWTPDVYEGAPVTITAFLSVASKAAGFAMLMRFLKVTFIDTGAVGLVPGVWTTIRGFQLTEIIVIISVLTMTLGNFAAIWQDNMKRLLAYSSIAHAGYMLLGLVVLGNDGYAAVMIYFVMYLFMNLGAFFVVMLVADKTGSEDIHSYKGLGSRAPFASVVMAIFLVSLTGLPPTAGFIGKLYIFAALINAKFIWLAVIGVLNSVVSLYYYVRVFRNIFISEPEGSKDPIAFSSGSFLLMIMLVVPTLVLGLYFGPLVEFVQNSMVIFGTK